MLKHTHLTGFGRRVPQAAAAWTIAKNSLYANTPSISCKFTENYAYLAYQFDQTSGPYGIEVLKLDLRKLTGSSATDAVVWARRFTDSTRSYVCVLDISTDGSRVFVALRHGSTSTEIFELSGADGTTVASTNITRNAYAIAYNNSEDVLYLGGTYSSAGTFGWVGAINTATWASAYHASRSLNQRVQAMVADEVNGGAWGGDVGSYLLHVQSNGTVDSLSRLSTGYVGIYGLAFNGGQLAVAGYYGLMLVDVSGTPTKVWARDDLTNQALMLADNVFFGRGGGPILAVYAPNNSDFISLYAFDRVSGVHLATATLSRSDSYSQDVTAFCSPYGGVLYCGQLPTGDSYALACAYFSDVLFAAKTQTSGSPTEFSYSAAAGPLWQLNTGALSSSTNDFDSPVSLSLGASQATNASASVSLDNFVRF